MYPKTRTEYISRPQNATQVDYFYNAAFFPLRQPNRPPLETNCLKLIKNERTFIAVNKKSGRSSSEEVFIFKKDLLNSSTIHNAASDVAADFLREGHLFN